MAVDGHGEAGLKLKRAVDPARDHARGAGGVGTVVLVAYGDYLCPYCRRQLTVLSRLQEALGDSLVYVFRQFPNERIHPGSELLSRAAIAAGAQGRFWQMHDWLYSREPPIALAEVVEFAGALGLDTDRFAKDMESEATRERMREDLADGRASGVTSTPTFFIDGMRYDDAWDFHSMLEALRRPIAAQLHRSARAFANLPASAGLSLLLAALAALICANSPIAPHYKQLMGASFDIGIAGHSLSMTIAEWASEGLLAAFFLLVGLEIRRELTSGALTDPRAAVLPVVAAIGGVLVPAAIYLAINTSATADGWSVPTATDVAFTIGILALMENRVPVALRIFVAALAVVDDILSMLTLAIFYPRSFDAEWLAASAIAIALLFALNRARVYVGWPYAVGAAALWLTLHATGVHAALAGVVLAAFIPTRPAPSAGPLLAQAATALVALEHAERENQQHAAGSSAHISQSPVWEWAGRNLSAASARLMSPAERVERVIAPWSAYVILPLFAFSATGVSLAVTPGSSDDVRILMGVVLGLVLGKPLGVLAVSGLAIKMRIGVAPRDTRVRTFLGAACLCGVGDTVALLMADQAFSVEAQAAIAKIGVLAGSALAATLGALIIATDHRARPGVINRAPSEDATGACR